MDYQPLSHADTAACVELWNQTFPLPFRIDAALWDHCTWHTPGFVADETRVVWEAGAPIGVVVTKLWRYAALGRLDHTLGFISALLVRPDRQRQGLGAQLLAWAEQRLREQGVKQIVLGRDIQPFFCGVPDSLNALPFFQRHGYHTIGMVYDTKRDLAGYTPHPQAVATRARLGSRLDIRELAEAEIPELVAFLDREFPGRWSFEIGHFLAQGGSANDIVILRLNGQVHGFAHLHSPGAPPTAYGMNWRLALTQPSGGLGPIGVSQAVRGEKLGLTLLDAGLTILASRGVRDCVIDWTTLVDFYAKVGFLPWLAYHQAEKHQL